MANKIVKKWEYIKLIFIPIVLYFVFAVPNIFAAIMSTETVKMAAVIFPLIFMVSGFSMVVLLLNVFLVSKYKYLCCDNFDKDYFMENKFRWVNRHFKIMSVLIGFLYAFAPLLMITLQIIRKTPSDHGSAIVNSTCSLGLGIMILALMFLSLRRVQVKLLQEKGIFKINLPLKYKVILPFLCMVVFIIISIVEYGYTSIRGIYLEPTLYKRQILLDNEKSKFLSNMNSGINETDWNNGLLQDENIFIVFDNSGVVVATNQSDLNGKNLTTDYQKDWRTENMFRESIRNILDGEKSGYSFFLGKKVYYFNYVAIPEKHLYLLSGVLSNKFWMPTNKTVLIMAIFGWLGLGIFTIFALRYVSRKFNPLTKVVNGLKEIADGNLSLQFNYNYDNDDEIGDMLYAMKEMLGALRNLTSKMKISSDDLLKISGSVDETSSKISTGTDESSRSINEVSESVNKLTDSISKVNHNINDQNQKTEIVYRSIETFSKSMQEINTKTEEANLDARKSYEKVQSMEKEITGTIETMRIIGESSHNIAEALSMIEDISDQINLLSLNASIEAARAGESGRGFAVVADEIGKLADKTSHETKEIDSLIKSSVLHVQKGVDSVASISDGVRDMNSAVSKTTKIIDDINLLATQFTDEAKKLFGEMQDLNSLSAKNAEEAKSQQAITSLVEERIASMNKIMEETLQEIQKFISISEELSLQSSLMKQTVAFIKDN